MKTITLKELAVKHDYYASDHNYYSNEAAISFNTWADFFEEFNNADVDMNLVYRWDISLREESKRYRMEVFIIGQRKGKYIPVSIDYVDEKDVETILPFMQKHWDKLCAIWAPLS